MADVTLRNTKGSPLTYTEVDNNFKACDADRNVIINGTFNIWQRGITFNSVTSGDYLADRFKWEFSGSGDMDFTRASTSNPTKTEAGIRSNYHLLGTKTLSDTSIAATDFYSLRYDIEGFDYSPIEGNTYTLSFWVNVTKTGTYCVAFRNSGADRSYVVEYTVDSSNTWEKKTITVNFNYSGGTWDYTNGIGLRINWTLAAGTNFHTTAGAWQTGNFTATSNQVNGMDATGDTFRLALVKLEPGSESTVIRPRAFEAELALCQRYYQKSYNLTVDPGTIDSNAPVWQSNGAGASIAQHPVIFPVQMRTTPTIVVYSTVTGNSGVLRNITGAVDAAGSGAESHQAGFNFRTTAAAATDARYSAHYTVDAEL